jgi:hypothetical protein
VIPHRVNEYEEGFDEELLVVLSEGWLLYDPRGGICPVKRDVFSRLHGTVVSWTSAVPNNAAEDTVVTTTVVPKWQICDLL